MGTSLTSRCKSPARINPQDHLSAITAVVGTSSRGTVNAMQTLQQSTLRSTQGGYSPACSTVAELPGRRRSPGLLRAFCD